MKWTQLWVSHPTANVAKLMKHHEETLMRFSALPCAPLPSGDILVEPDGTVEVRVMADFFTSIVKMFLQDNGFVIEREKENE